MSDASTGRPRLRRRAVLGVQAGLEALWTGAFRILHAARGSGATPLRFGDGAPVLVVAPHPDDEVAGCGGTILRHTAAGDPVTVVYVTDGSRSGALGLPPDRMAAVRHREAAAAAAVLGVDRRVWLGLREGDWSGRAFEAGVGEVLQAVRPAVVYAPSRVDFHPEHKAVAHALARTLAVSSGAAEEPRIRVFQVQVPLGAALVDRYAMISPLAREHDAAIAAHASQVGSVSRCRRMKRYAARAHGSSGLAEEFWEMSAARYIALHRTPPEEWAGRFRAFRYLAAADPAAYLAGRAARRRLLTADVR